MSKLLKNTIIALSTLSSIFIVSFFWKSIELPFSNTDEVVGLLSIKKYNPLNDTLKYIIFISIPLLTYILLNYYFFEKKFINLKEILREKNQFSDDFKIKENKFIFLFLFIYILIELFSIDIFAYNFDNFHYGDYLTPAENFYHKKKIWSSSFNIHGASDVLYPVLAWNIFNIKTIGAIKVFFLLMIFLNKILLIFLAFQITKISQNGKELKTILFLILGIIMINMAELDRPLNSYFSTRHFFILIYLILFLEIFYSNKFRFLLNALLTFVPIIALIHHDIGIYLYFIFFLYLAYLVLLKNYKILFFNLCCTIIYFIIFLSIFGISEFNAFLENILFIIKNIDIIHGLEYAHPFFDLGKNNSAARATNGLVFQLILGLIFINNFFFKNTKFFGKKKIIILFFFILSFITYKNALGRSDAGHIRISLGIPLVLLSFFILNYLLALVQTKFKAFITKKYLSTISIIISLFFLFTEIEINNIKKFNTNIKNLIIAKDEKYLDRKTKNLINYVNLNLYQETCISNFTFDLSLSYLIKKPTCTKFRAPWLASGKNVEKKFIQDLKNNKAIYIIYRGQETSVDAINLKTRLKYVDDYIIKNYEEFYDDGTYLILKKSS